MNSAILEAVRKSLPEMEMAALKAELAKAERLASVEAALSDARKSLDVSLAANKVLETKVAILEAKLIVQDAFERRERDLRVTLLETELKAQAASKQDLFALMNAAFRNTVRNRSINDVVVLPGSNGCGSYTNTVVKTETESET